MYFVNGPRGREECPAKVAAGEDMTVVVTARDDFDNLCEEVLATGILWYLDERRTFLLMLAPEEPPSSEPEVAFS